MGLRFDFCGFFSFGVRFVGLICEFFSFGEGEISVSERPEVSVSERGVFPNSGFPIRGEEFISEQ